MQPLIQLILIIWAIAFSLLIFVPSVSVLLNKPKQLTIFEPPKPPDAPVWRNGGLQTNEVAVYTQVLAVYQQSVIAYNAYIEAVKKSDPNAVYALVVKDTIVALFRDLIVGFLGFAFVKSAATTLYNVGLVKRGQNPLPPKLFE